MRPSASAMVQDFGIRATCFFQGIGENRQAVESTVIVNLLGQDNNLGREPGGFERDGTERVSENAADQMTLSSPLVVVSVNSIAVGIVSNDSNKISRRILAYIADIGELALTVDGHVQFLFAGLPFHETFQHFD